MATVSVLRLVPRLSKTSVATEARSRQKPYKTPRTKPEQDVEIAMPAPAAPKLAPAKREAVLNACFLTSAGLGAAGLAVRQASHYLANLGYFPSDCTLLLAYNLRPWHVGATLGLVVSISLLRLGLLAIWPDFAQSTQASNERVLSSLRPLDCVAVAFSSGVSEELLFRGALLPLVGLDIKGVVISGIVFGALHVTGGRNAAFATWASVVGVIYGFAAVWTSDLCVPMFAHSSANLVAALYWKYKLHNAVDLDT